MVKDMEKATYYPPTLVDEPTGAELASDVNKLLDIISVKQKEAAEKPKAGDKKK